MRIEVDVPALHELSDHDFRTVMDEIDGSAVLDRVLRHGWPFNIDTLAKVITDESVKSGTETLIEDGEIIEDIANLRELAARFSHMADRLEESIVAELGKR